MLVRFEVTPATAEITVNGSVVTIYNAEQGETINVSVSADGYITQTFPYTVNDDVTIHVDLIQLMPEANETEYFDYASYLANLLIIQYHDKAKAVAHIKNLATLLPVNLILQVRDSFDIETAVGKQLDTLGKYVFVDRWYNDNGEYAQLNDDEFRVLIKLKAIANTSNLSHKSLDEALYNFFGEQVRASSDGGMEMTYFVPANATKIITAAIQKQVLPIPMGVECKYIVEQEYKFYGYVTYSDQYAIYKTGFLTYDDPDKTGESFTYNKTIPI